MTTLSRAVATFLVLPNGITPMLVPCPCLIRRSPVLPCRSEYVGGDFNEAALAATRLTTCSEQCACQGTGIVVRDATEGEVLIVLAAMGWEVHVIGWSSGRITPVWSCTLFRSFAVTSIKAEADTPKAALNAAIEEAAGGGRV